MTNLSCSPSLSRTESANLTTNSKSSRETAPFEATDYEAEVAIVGAGIIGSCSAYYLAQEGIDVVVLERGRRNGEASGNNAGSLHVQLLAYDFGDWAQASGGPAAQTLPLQRESAALWPELAAALDIEFWVARKSLPGAPAGHQVVELDPLAPAASPARRSWSTVGS